MILNSFFISVNDKQIDTVNINQYIYIFHKLREKWKNIIFYVNMQMNPHIEFISTVTSAQHLWFVQLDLVLMSTSWDRKCCYVSKKIVVNQNNHNSLSVISQKCCQMNSINSDNIRGKGIHLKKMSIKSHTWFAFTTLPKMASFCRKGRYTGV